MEIHALAIPLAQTVSGKSVAQIIGAWPDAALFRLQPSPHKQKAEGVSCGLNRKPASVHADEKTCIPFRRAIRHASSKVSIQFSGEGTMKGNPPSPSLESVDKENAGSSIHILQAEAKRFSKPNSGTVQDQNQRPVKCGSERRVLEISAKTQKVEDVRFGKKIWHERGPGRQMGPNRFSYIPRLRYSTQVAVELSENRGIVREALSRCWQGRTLFAQG
jgi:hypothetical protein